MKRFGLMLILVVGVVVSIEGTLAVLRQRSIDVEIQVQGSVPGSRSAPAATPPALATPLPSVNRGTLIMAPDGIVLVDVIWTYRIGPRFPDTLIRAEIVNSSGQAVASGAYNITCNPADSMQCEGKTSLALRFGEKDGTGAPAPWPTGEYTLHVTRAYAGLAQAVSLSERTVQVFE